MQRLLTGAGLAIVAAAAVPAAARASTCDLPDYGATTKAFAAFGDDADYFLAPGGDFEGPLAWAGRGTPATVAGNEPFLLTGGGEHALQLGGGDAVTSPKLCVGRTLPHLRFVARANGSGQLDVEVRVYDAYGRVTDASSGSVSPSDPVELKTQGLKPGQTTYVTVSFRSQGDWLVDDVLVDPYRR